jgi:hypothetical protein
MVPQLGVLNVSGQESILQIVTVQPEPSIIPIMVIMNVNTVLINVPPVPKNLKLVLLVLKTELMLQVALVHQVSSMNQKTPSVPDVLKNVKPVPLAVLVSLVTTQDSMLHTVIAQPVNSKFVELNLKSDVMLNVQIHNVTNVIINVPLVKVLMITVLHIVLVTELTNQIVFAQKVIMMPVLPSVHLVTVLVLLVNSTKDVV